LIFYPTELEGSKSLELGLPEVCIVCNIYAVGMTKNQVKKRSFRSNKEHPGCMGSILHLFDFPSGKKLLTDKTHKHEEENRRISLDGSNDFVEMPKSRDAKNEYGLIYDSRKSPATKKASGLPMKALIAEEMSKELEAKRRTPSVVARLMGLDTFPAEAMLAEHMQDSDNEPQKITSGKHQQQPKPSCDAGISPQKSRTSVCKEISFQNLSRSLLIIENKRHLHLINLRESTCTDSRMSLRLPNVQHVTIIQRVNRWMNLA